MEFPNLANDFLCWVPPDLRVMDKQPGSQLGRSNPMGLVGYAASEITKGMG